MSKFENPTEYFENLELVLKNISKNIEIIYENIKNYHPEASWTNVNAPIQTENIATFLKSYARALESFSQTKLLFNHAIQNYKKAKDDGDIEIIGYGNWENVS